MASDGCLLCLELKKEFVGAILVNSIQWNELSIRYIIGKYLWPMKHIQTSSWLCTNCWEELYQFHMFYMRIENTHKDFGLFTEIVADLEKIDSNKECIGDQEVEMHTIELQENPVNISLDLPAEKKEENDGDTNFHSFSRKNECTPFLKIEFQEESPDDNNLRLKRKRGRPRKDILSGTHIPNAASKKTPLQDKDLCHPLDGSTNSSNKTKRKEKNRTKEINEDKMKTTEEMKNSVHCTKKEDDLIVAPKKQHISLGNETAPIYDNDLISPFEEKPMSIDNDSDSKNYTDRESLDSADIKSNNEKNCLSKSKCDEKDKFLAENMKMECFLCETPLETFYNVKKHFEIHHKEHGYILCCDKKFYRRSILIDHVNYHLNPNYFKCSQCNIVMEDRRRLELHNNKAHEINNGRNHRCIVCGKGFLKIGHLNNHKMIHYSEEQKKFPCSECSKNFASNFLLSNHYRTTHLKKYVKICDICGKSIRDKTVFERHMLQHEGKRSLSASCDICGLRLTDEKALKRHKDVIHPAGGQKTFICSICSKTSPSLRAHKLHVQFTHESSYNYKCTICDKAFKRAATLKEHMASHTGIVLYTCPWCPKTFNSNGNMHNHRKRVHPKEWEEARRKRYSGKLPPRYKPPTTTEPSDLTVP